MKHIQESIRKTRGYTDRFWILMAQRADFDRAKLMFGDNFQIFLRSGIMLYCLSDADIQKFLESYEINEDTKIYLANEKNFKTFEEIEDHFAGLSWYNFDRDANSGILIEYSYDNIKKLLKI